MAHTVILSWMLPRQSRWTSPWLQDNRPEGEVNRWGDRRGSLGAAPAHPPLPARKRVWCLLTWATGFLQGAS